MSFTELNSVEYYIIHKLSGANLNLNLFSNNFDSYNWIYKAPEKLNRGIADVLIEGEVKEALIKLNPEIKKKPELAVEVIYKLRVIISSVNQFGLVKANEDFFEWLRGDKTMPFGKNNDHIAVRLIDFDNVSNNKYIITNQFKIKDREVKIPDVVLMINGIPIVVGEAKTPIRPAISWLDGAHEIHDIYENAIPQLFVPNILSFATEGKELFYGAVRSPLQYWSPWRVNEDKNDLVKKLSLGEVGEELLDLLSPERLLDILKNFSLFSMNKKKQRSKIICRFQQYEGANKIVERVVDGKEKKGLIWHFQGSGKSLLMVFVAQKLRKLASLKSPTVLVLVDRTDLDTQISGTFNAADIPNIESTENIKELQKLLELDTRKIIISTIHKFRDAKPDLNLRDNIIVLVDEAHRTQEGDLGRQMRAALPNAFLFGLTGTPVNKFDKNTFWAFGSKEDKSGYLSRYSFEQSIRDNATLKLHFEPRLIDLHVDRKTLDKAMEEFKESAALTDEEADALNKKSAKMSAFLKSPERVSKIVEDIAIHFKEKVQPHEFKAMIVTPDREACVQYKKELDKYFKSEASAVVITTSANDDFDFKKKWGIDKSQQQKIVDNFNDKDSDLKFIIVTAKLLTGFDAPILQTMYLDKSLKEHTLIQAICRTNRPYPGKTFGCVVDYFGVFDDIAKSLNFDEREINSVISNISELRDNLKLAIEDTLKHFDGVDRTIEGFEGLQQAQEKINTDSKKDNFAKDYKFLSNIWESLSPDKILDLYNKEFKWLTNIYDSVRPSSDNTGKLLWFTFGAKTISLIHENIHAGNIHKLEEFVLDGNVIEDIIKNPDSKKIKEVEKILISRFKKYKNNPKFKNLSERLIDIKNKLEEGLITSIEFVKELCKIAKETLQSERELKEKTPQAALTDLFVELKSDKTPAVVGRIVNDIDSIVKIVRFPNWQNSNAGQREVQKSLRQTLLKYNLHKDQILFERAYEYIKEYY
jgi:type I restriction enzyme R subunit